MKFKEYIEQLVKFSEDNPESLNCKVVSSANDEGDSFNLVCFAPSLGRFEYSDFSVEDLESKDINAVCIN